MPAAAAEVVRSYYARQWRFLEVMVVVCVAIFLACTFAIPLAFFVFQSSAWGDVLTSWDVSAFVLGCIAADQAEKSKRVRR